MSATKSGSTAKAKAILSVMGLPGRKRDGADTEWLLGVEEDMERVGNGPRALAITMAALYMQTKETSAIPTAKRLPDQHVRRWMIKIAIHKAAIDVGSPFPSVAMHYLIEKTREWGATIAETARQLLKHGELPDNYGDKRAT